MKVFELIEQLERCGGDCDVNVSLETSESELKTYDIGFVGIDDGDNDMNIVFININD